MEMTFPHFAANQDSPRRVGLGMLLASAIASQVDIHRLYGGVVPEVASRNHILHVRPLVEQVLTEAGVKLADMRAGGFDPFRANAAQTHFSQDAKALYVDGQDYAVTTSAAGRLVTPNSFHL